MVAAYIGNVSPVQSMNDMMMGYSPEPELQLCTAVSGDNPFNISKQFCAARNKYPQLFVANQSMPTHPDKIYPGQGLRIPPTA